MSNVIILTGCLIIFIIWFIYCLYLLIKNWTDDDFFFESDIQEDIVGVAVMGMPVMCVYTIIIILTIIGK